MSKLIQRTYFLPYILLLLGGVLTTGCGLRPLLYDVSVSPEAITPNADGIADVTRISYKLSRSANLSIFLVDGEGQEHYFRRQRPRGPAPGIQPLQHPLHRGFRASPETRYKPRSPRLEYRPS